MLVVNNEQGFVPTECKFVVFRVCKSTVQCKSPTLRPSSNLFVSAYLCNKKKSKTFFENKKLFHFEPYENAKFKNVFSNFEEIFVGGVYFFA